MQSTMRKTRLIEHCRCYHLVSRLAHRAFFLDDEEKTRAVGLLRRAEEFDDASVYDIFWENPPYYLWRNPYWALRLTKDDRELNECIKGIRKSMDSVHTDRYSLSCFCYDNIVLAFRINISPKEFDNAVNEGRCVDLK